MCFFKLHLVPLNSYWKLSDLIDPLIYPKQTVLSVTVCQSKMLSFVLVITALHQYTTL